MAQLAPWPCHVTLALIGGAWTAVRTWGACLSFLYGKPPPPGTKGVSGNLFGGAEGTRTPDLLNAIQTRSQLRYSPTTFTTSVFGRIDGGAEGTRTPDLYSAIVALSQLSYSPPVHLRATV